MNVLQLSRIGLWLYWEPIKKLTLVTFIEDKFIRELGCIRNDVYLWEAIKIVRMRDSR